MWRRFEIRDRIQQLDPITDCQQILFFTGTFEFPWLVRKSLEFALFRSFGAPSISKILDRTGQFRDHGQRRFDDTALLIAELVENGYDSPRGRLALRMMNHMHRPHHIRNGDMLYVLSTFVFEPILWVERYGWRKLLQQEKLANLHFWREVGKRMAIQDIPETLEAFAHFQQEYERENYGYHPANRRVAEATIAVMQDWYPRFPYKGTRWAVYSLLNDTLRRAFDFPKAPALISWALHGSLMLGGKSVRFLPPRRRPYLYTQQKHRSYPDGYEMEKLGPV